MRIVLVHGFLNRGSIMRPLARLLERAGHTTLTPSLSPCDARFGIAHLASQLKTAIDAKFDNRSPVALIGFSMGAVVSRFYLQKLGGNERVILFASIAGPHYGTWTAPLYRSQGTDDMRIGSAFLADLNSNLSSIEGIPTVCYWTPFDLMIRPKSTTHLPHADIVRVPAPIHSLLVLSPSLHRDLIDRLAKLREETPDSAAA